MLPWAPVGPWSVTVDGWFGTLVAAAAPETDWTGSAFDGDDESCWEALPSTTGRMGGGLSGDDRPRS